MNVRWWVWGLLGAAAIAVPAQAEDAGKRDFPATLVVDEPQVETEIAPQVSTWTFGGASRTDFSTELSLQLAKPFSVIIHPDYTLLRPGGGGLQALELGAKYQFTANAAHEFIISAGLSSTLGGTGSTLVDAYTSLIPTLYYGKGAGDLPNGLAWARPLALTGQIAYAVPTQARSQSGAYEEGPPQFDANPSVLNLSGSLQYSLPYAEENVPSITIPKVLAVMVPLVEYEVAIPVAYAGPRIPTVGTVNPGVLWIDEAHNTTWGLEALFPINKASGNHPGARLQLSYSFDAPWPLVGKAPN